MKPCKNCPFRKGNEWIGGGFAKIMAVQETARQQKFSCHMKHHDSNIFSLKDMEHNDCSGFAMMKENRVSQGKHPEVVNGFNETGPAVDLLHWFYKNSNDLNILKLL